MYFDCGCRFFTAHDQAIVGIVFVKCPTIIAFLQLILFQYLAVVFVVNHVRPPAARYVLFDEAAAAVVMVAKDPVSKEIGVFNKIRLAAVRQGGTTYRSRCASS